MDTAQLIEWLNAKLGSAQAQREQSYADWYKGYYTGQVHFLRDVIDRLQIKQPLAQTPIDPPTCDGDGHHPNEPYDEETYTPNPNNPEVNYGDGKADKIKGLKL